MLGSRVRDKISGFEGIVTSICQYDNKPNRVQVTAQSLSERGAIIEEWIDEDRLEVLDAPSSPEE
ncbi:MAG: hypothetical protein ACRD3J_30735 [Thermoanaerobaculia bacterium]